LHTVRQTRPVIEYYEAQAKNKDSKAIRVARIPGQLERDEVFARIKAAVDPLIGQEVLALTERLLGAIAAGDWATYEELCAADMTCFEPEARGHLVEGLVREGGREAGREGGSGVGEGRRGFCVWALHCTAVVCVYVTPPPSRPLAPLLFVPTGVPQVLLRERERPGQACLHHLPAQVSE
jgi:hypothetical protein